MNRRIRAGRGSWMLMTLGLPLQAALAEDATEATSDALPEVMVTAQHRSENERDVPVSTTVLRGDQLDSLGDSGQDIKQLAFAVPSLNIESSNGRAFPRLYIRGYGNTDYHDFASQPVGLYLDDIVQETPGLKGFPIFDQEDVEVLRGPQGTMFGRNAPAGVVQFVSAKPKLNETSGSFSFSDGTFGSSVIQGVLNAPLGDNVAFRASIQDQRRDNWVYDPINLGNYGGYSDLGVRLQLLVKASDDFSLLFNVHGRDLSGSSTLFRANIIQPDSYGALVPGFNPAVMYADGPNNQTLQTLGANVHMTWNLPSVTLQSITGYETVQKYLSEGDIDGGYGSGNVFGPAAVPTGPGNIPFPVQTSAAITHHEQLSQEFRALTVGEGPLQAQGGLYLFYENVTAADNDYCTPGGTGTPGTACYNQNLWTLQDTTVSTQHNDAEAVFGSLEYTPLQKLKLRAGVRYTMDHKSFNIPYVTTVPLPTAPYSATANASNTSWDVSGTWAFTKDINWYARIATGFRAPSFGPPVAGYPVQVAQSETNISYETGIKADFWDHKARLSWDVYYYDVKHQQLSATGAGAEDLTVLLNANKTLGKGSELEFEIHPIANLTLGLSGSFNWTKIIDPGLEVAPCFNFGPAVQCHVTNPIDPLTGQAEVNGNPLPQAAKWVGDLFVRYDYPLTDSSNLYVYTDWSSRSSMNLAIYSAREFTAPALTQGGLRIGYSWDNGKYDVAAFCRNCTNQIRLVGQIDFDNFTGYVNDPRVFGGQFKVKF